MRPPPGFALYGGEGEILERKDIEFGKLVDTYLERIAVQQRREMSIATRSPPRGLPGRIATRAA